MLPSTLTNLSPRKRRPRSLRHSPRPATLRQTLFSIRAYGLGGGGAPTHASSATKAAALRKIEDEIRTLYISPYAQLNAAGRTERKEQVFRSKSVPAKRKPACPGTR